MSSEEIDIMRNAAAFEMAAPLEVGISCRDLTTMRHFYECTLGLRLVHERFVPANMARALRLSRAAATVVRLQTSYGERVKLIGSESSASTGNVASEFFLDRQNVTYLTFIVEDIDAAMERVRAASVELITGDKCVESHAGVYVSFFRDPEGNLVELVQYDDIPAYRPDLAPAA